MRTSKYQPKNSVYRFGAKQAKFIEYLNSKYPEYSVYRTIGYVQSNFVSNILRANTDALYIYDNDDVRILKHIFVLVRNDERDIKLHKVYSSAVNRYINFLSVQSIAK